MDAQMTQQVRAAAEKLGHEWIVDGWSAGPRWFEEDNCSRCVKSVDDLDAMLEECREYDGPSN